MIPTWCERCNQPADDPFFWTDEYGYRCEDCAMQLIHVLSKDVKPIQHITLNWRRCTVCNENLAKQRREWSETAQ